MVNLLTLDANIFIAEIKGNEEYSELCKKIIGKVGKDFILIEPSILITEVGNAVARNLNQTAAKDTIKNLLNLVAKFHDCDVDFCSKAALTGAKFNIYSADSLYLQTSFEYNTILISLDEDDFIARIKAKESRLNVYHPREII